MDRSGGETMMDAAVTLREESALRADAFPEPLSGLVMGDAAAAGPREHGWPGKIFIAFTYFMSVSAAGGGLVTLVSLASLGTGGAMPWRQAVAGCVWGVLQWRLATELRRFSRWGWFGAMAELGGAAAFKVFWMFALPSSAFAFLLLLGIDVGMLRY